MTTYVLKCYCYFKTRYKPHVNIAAQKGKSLKCCPNIRKFEKSHRLGVLQLVLDTIEYKTLPIEYLWLRLMNVKQRLPEKNEFLKNAVQLYRYSTEASRGSASQERNATLQTLLKVCI